MNNEKGQALPMAILALAIGALVIVPFLNHAGTTLLDSRLYASGINSRDAADAGVEHAIWNLTEGGLAQQIPDANDTHTYPLPEVLNGITPSIKVTTIAKGSGGGTAGTINKTILDSLIYDATAGYTPDVVHAANDIFAVAYTGGSNKGYVKTMSVTENGTIGNATISTLQIETSAGYEQDLFAVTGNIYAMAYRGNANRGVLRTMSISAAGVLSAAYISTLNFDASTCYTPSVVQISSTIYAIAYRGASNRGYLKTVSISAAGVIGSPVISSLTFDSTACYEPKIVKVTGNYYAIAYRGGTNRGNLKTVSISSSGVISGTVVSTLIFDATACYTPDILNVSGTYYVIAYQGGSTQGKLVTVTIAANGVIGGAVISTLIFDSSSGYEPSITRVITTTYAIAYRSATFKGYLKSVTIAANGVISATIIDTYNYDATTCYEPSLIQIASNVYGIAYRGTGTDGILITIGVSDGTGNPVNSYEIISTAGDASIRALVNTQNSTSGMTSAIISWFPN